MYSSNGYIPVGCPSSNKCDLTPVLEKQDETLAEINKLSETVLECCKKVNLKLNLILLKCNCKIVAWEQNVYYDVGALVLDNGKIMECIKANQSNFIHILDENYWKIKEILENEEENTVKSMETNKMVVKNDFTSLNDNLVAYEEKKTLFGRKKMVKKEVLLND